mgnify:CR=1 FL=1
MEKDECEFGFYCSVAKYDAFFSMAAGASGRLPDITADSNSYSTNHSTIKLVKAFN